MSNHISRLRNLGLMGAPKRQDYSTKSTNTADGYFVTVQVPITRVASAAAQTTAVMPSPNAKFIQIISAVLVTTTAEVAGTTKNISIGIGPGATNVLNAASCASVGASGSPSLTTINLTPSTNKFTYTLGSADFAQFTGYALVSCFVVE